MLTPPAGQIAKIVVVGATGRIGEKLVANLRQEDCRVFAASPRTGVDTVTGAGLTQALAGPDALIAPQRFDDWLRDSLQPQWSSSFTRLH